MKILIAITSYEGARHNGMNDAVRDTWLKDLDRDKADAVFFFGHGVTEPLRSDEVYINAADDYLSLPHKTVESTRWALNSGYDLIFRTYPDVYIRPERLLAAIPDQSYVGFPMMGTNGVPYASGGAGYWLQAREAAFLLDTTVPYDWAEDRWVGTVMQANNVVLYADPRYSPIPHPPLLRNEQITSHLSRPSEEGKQGTYKSQWMYNTHKFWTLSQTI